MNADRRVGAAVWAAATVVFVAAAWSLGKGVFEFPFDRDAAHWIPRARQVAEGQVPYVDFDAAYAPGPFYAAALLGVRGLRSPALVKAFFYAFHFVDAGLLYAVLRRLGHAASTASLLASVGLAYVCACDGFAVEAEPLQLAFALGAAWVLLSARRKRAFVVAGLLAGVSLMMKQYSLLFIPPLALVAAGRRPASDEASPLPGAWTRVALFLAALPCAFLVFVAATGQGPVAPLTALVTYGGHRYAPDGLRSALHLVAGGRLTRPLLVAAALAAVTLAVRRTGRAAVVLLGLTLSLAPLYVRGYPHYLQLAAPWAAVATAEFAAMAASRSERPTRTAAVVAALCVAAWIDPVVLGLREAHHRMTSAPIAGQIEIARRVQESVGDPNGVLMINLEWVYALSDLRPPLSRPDMRYGEPLVGLAPQRDAARCVVVGPGLVTAADAEAWLAEDGFRETAVIDPRLPLRLFERASK